MTAENPYAAPIGTVAPSAIGSAEVSDAIFASMRATRPWVRFLSIMGFIFSLLFAGVALVVLALGSFGDGGAGVPPPWLGAIYAPLAVFYVPPSLFLWRYASAIDRFVHEPSQLNLSEALARQKTFWLFVGVAIVVIIAMYLAGAALAVMFFAFKVK